jgi:hypothetical protein
LAKHQYSLQPLSAPTLVPDSSRDLGGYAYYPVFVQALRIRKNLSESMADAASRAERIRELKSLKDSALTLLRTSTLNSSNRKRYEWHVRDALRPELWVPPQRPQLASPDSAPADSGTEE